MAQKEKESREQQKGDINFDDFDIDEDWGD